MVGAIGTAIAQEQWGGVGGKYYGPLVSFLLCFRAFFGYTNVVCESSLTHPDLASGEEPGGRAAAS